MQVTAIARNVRISPMKVRLVVAQIRKIKPTDSLLILDHVPQKASRSLKKVIASAVANAKNNYALNPETLTFKELNVNKGQVFKRYRAVARGRAHSIIKHTANIRIVLEGEKEEKKEVSNVAKVSGVTNEIEEKKELPKESKTIVKQIKNDKK